MKGNFLKNMFNAEYAGAGGWNDPDMLEIGTGLLTLTEEATHFALWSFSKAPLMLSAQFMRESPSLDIVMNSRYIEINQDELGNQAKRSK